MIGLNPHYRGAVLSMENDMDYYMLKYSSWSK